MKKQIIEEIKDIKYLFNYDRGRIISEQPEVEEMSDLYEMGLEDAELDEEMDVPVMLPGTKEKERTITTPGTKPRTKPKTPYRPKPGPKPDPKAKRKGDMPDWLTFDELGIDFE
jgi:hypothetical protein